MVNSSIEEKVLIKGNDFRVTSKYFYTKDILKDTIVETPHYFDKIKSWTIQKHPYFFLTELLQDSKWIWVLGFFIFGFMGNLYFIPYLIVLGATIYIHINFKEFWFFFELNDERTYIYKISGKVSDIKVKILEMQKELSDNLPRETYVGSNFS